MIQILGISHNTAPLELREKFSFSAQETDLLARNVIRDGILSELVVVSTCNRTEFYFEQSSTSAEESFRFVFEKVCLIKNIHTENFDSFYRFLEKDAVYHLFCVSSGLDSMILGEDQIIGQIKEAYLYCTNKGYTDAILMRLFQKSFETGKRVRSETEIRQGTTAVSYLAIDLCKQHFCTFNDKSVLVIGAGEAGGMIVSRLKKLQVGQIILANRNIDKATHLLDGYPGKAISLSEIKSYLRGCNAIIGAAASPDLLVTKDDIELNVDTADQAGKLFIDISVPQTIDRSVSEIEGILAFSVDDMQELATKNAEKRKASLGPAQMIVRSVTGEFMEWYDSRALRPVIQTIKANLKKFSQNELSDFQKANSGDIADFLELYNSHLTQKYIRLFIKNLKAMSENSNHKDYVELVNSLFKIS
jgi:glutamyl-tRNA reductase